MPWGAFHVGPSIRQATAPALSARLLYSPVAVICSPGHAGSATRLRLGRVAGNRPSGRLQVPVAASSDSRAPHCRTDLTHAGSAARQKVRRVRGYTRLSNAEPCVGLSTGHASALDTDGRCSSAAQSASVLLFAAADCKRLGGPFCWCAFR